MNCPRCSREFSFWQFFRIFNPWKHRCPNCSALLTGGRRATITIALGCVIGLAIAVVAIVMEEAKLWTTKDRVIWFAFALPAAIAPYQYWCWKWVRLRERDTASSLFASHKIAGWLYFVPAGLVAGIWYIYLFVAMPNHLTVWQSLVAQMQYTFSGENPQAWWFAWMIALPLACILLAVAYLLNVPRGRLGRLLLFAAAIGLAISTFLLNDSSLAMFVALPTPWGYRAIHAT